MPHSLRAFSFRALDFFKTRREASINRASDAHLNRETLPVPADPRQEAAYSDPENNNIAPQLAATDHPTKVTKTRPISNRVTLKQG